VPGEDDGMAGGLGREFRTLRTAAGRTVASVAADAGLSVPYIANLENGRGNPTLGALSRLAAALDRRLVVRLSPVIDKPAPVPEVPASLGRFARSQRFRRSVAVMASAAGADDQEFTARLLGALASLSAALGRDLAEPDWARLLDAILLVSTLPEGGA
jgi:transcriptional regulator with XRE-family HTH domain